MQRSAAWCVVVVSLWIAVAAFADEVPAARGVSPAHSRAFPSPPLRLAANPAVEVLATVVATRAHEIERLRLWNEHESPARVGVVRELAEVITVDSHVAASSNEPFQWRGAVRVAGASRLRLKLDDVGLPRDAILWVYGNAGPAIGFDASLAYNGTLWTPSVDGDTITLEVQAGPGSASFKIVAAADIRKTAEIVPAGEACIKDAKCESGIDEFGGAV